MKSSFGIFFFGIVITSLAFATILPSAQFTTSPNDIWKLVYENDDVSVQIKDNSKNKETIVLRVFEQSTNLIARYDTFKNKLFKVSQARNKLLEITGVGRQNIIEALPFTSVGSVKVDGLFIESIFESAKKEMSQMFERQYFIGNKIFQVLYVSQGAGVSTKDARLILDLYFPKLLRAPSSELAGTEAIRKKPFGPHHVEDSSMLPTPSIFIAKPVTAQECSSLPVEKRRISITTTEEILTTVLASAGGCMIGIKDTIKNTFIELKDLVIGISNYETDSVYNEQVNSTLAVVWANFIKNPDQFLNLILKNSYNLAAQFVEDFQCMNAVAQTEALCKIIPFLISGGYLAKVVSKARFTFAETKAIHDGVSTATKSVFGVTLGAKELAEFSKIALQYELLGRSVEKISEAFRSSQWLEKRKITSLKKINFEDSNSFRSKDKKMKPVNMTAKIDGINPRIQKTILDVYNKLNDPKAVNQYTLDLFKEAALHMASRGKAADINTLKNGFITSQSIGAVIIKHLKASGDVNFTKISGNSIKAPKSRPIADNPITKNDKFRSVVKNGPFFDGAFDQVFDSGHGSLTHLLQRDMILSTVKGNLGPDSQQFWDFLGTKSGINWWVDLFDSGVETSFTRPEYISRVLSKVTRDK